MFVLGIAGGTGSGKTTVARETRRGAAAERCRWSSITTLTTAIARAFLPTERWLINYDHPDAARDRAARRAPRGAARGQHRRDAASTTFASTCAAPRRGAVEPAPVVIVEGILVLADERLRAQHRPQALRRHRRRHPADAPDPARHRAARPQLRAGARAVLRDGAPDAPRLRRAVEALGGPHHPRGRREPAGAGRDRRPSRAGDRQ